MQRFGLRDDQWERIKDFLPGREGHVGGNAADNRLFVEAVLYRYRTGIPWRDLPTRFGDWKIVHQRFSRWAKSGVFERIFKLLASDHRSEEHTSELQSLRHLVCRLLLEKKKKNVLKRANEKDSMSMIEGWTSLHRD